MSKYWDIYSYMTSSPKFSIVVPVYNRPQEVYELLESLERQLYKNFELIIVEDGSSERCKEVVSQFEDRLSIRYFYKDNSGPGDSRNFGMSKVKGEYIVLFDSDCLIPPEYFQQVESHLAQRPLDAYGGPDDEHPSFSRIQRAINYAMTSFITTGGIRGKKKQLDQFQPRSFNMGIRTQVMKDVGGFSDIHPGEDPDLSFRIMEKGYRVGLIAEAAVYHKRRIDFRKFAKQVYKFGVTRIILGKWHPGTLKAVYFLPSLFVLGSVGLTFLSVFFSAFFLLPFVLLAVLVFMESLLRSKNLSIALLSVVAAFVQLTCYGVGFFKSLILIRLLGHDERSIFPSFFFKSKSLQGDI